MNAATAIVVAGGRSTRMGEDKSLLPWGAGTMLDAVVDVVCQVAQEVLVVVATPRTVSAPQVRCVVDEMRGVGPIGGLHAGLRAASHHACVVVSCDAPLLTVALLDELLGKLAGNLAVVPVTDHGDQPLCAVWSVEAIEPLEAYVARGGRSLRGLLSEMTRVCRIPADELAGHAEFISVNTPDEYRAARDAYGESYAPKRS